MTRFTAAQTDVLIGKRIQQRRRELGISAEILAEKIGVSQQQFSRYERGVTKMNVSHLVDIAIVLDTPIGWFFCDTQAVNLTETKRYVPVHDDVLFSRFQYHWQRMSTMQKRHLINFLDSI